MFRDDREVFVYENPDLGIPICSLFNDDSYDNMNVYGTSGNSGKIDWDSWDIFIHVLVNRSLFVKKRGSMCPILLSYKGGFLVLTSLFRKRVIYVKNISCCTYLDDTIVVDTEELGSVRITFKRVCDALAIARVLSGFACGIYKAIPNK